MSVNIKWGKKVLSNVQVDKSSDVLTWKAQLYALTNVPVDRQKLMAKGIWKGVLKDDTDLSSIEKLVDGAQIMLMGSADVVSKPAQATVFMEDMTSAEIAEAGVQLPSGMANLGNTCYMNSTLQCLRPIAEFREALNGINVTGIGAGLNDVATNVATSLRDTLNQMDRSSEAVTPMVLVNTLRQAFPQFAQQGPKGGYTQQDSDEFLGTLLQTLGSKLTQPTASVPAFASSNHDNNMIDALFGIEMEETLSCQESESEAVLTKSEKSLKLVCNITKDTNHVAEGITVGLEGDLEKQSQVLGRNAVWKKSMRMNTLPKYLCVQFMRFYWKLTPDSRDHTGVKCKMLRPISFPIVLDVFEFCSNELKSNLKVWRDKNAEKILNEFKEDGEEKKTEEDEIKPMMDVEHLRSPGLGLPEEFMGNYELFAVVTHKGRSADSGHYIGWALDQGDDWFCFDDDEVSPCKVEDIQKLKGGGDWHMAYLTFYRAKN